MSEAEAEIAVRRATPGDLPMVLPLMRDSLGWGDDDRYPKLFRWKHAENPAGASPMWVATAGERIVALRALMRWEFTFGGRTVRAVRAVDTATHPEFQGKGLFRRLTMHGVDELTAEGTDWVFNTPNDQSRPGYLKMGWQEVGKLPIAVRPVSVIAMGRILRSRIPAERWSDASSVGASAPDVLADHPAIERLIGALPARGGVHTRLTPEFLAWRYGLSDLAYRIVTDPDGPESGLVVFRVRRRGAGREVAVAQVLAPGGPRQGRALVRRLAREVDADYLIALGADRRLGLAPLPRQGPLLTWRALANASMPPLDQWDLVLGDVELF